MMDNEIVYTGTSGAEVRFRAAGPWHYYGTDLHDYEWEADTVNDRAVSFRRKPREFSIKAVMDGGSAAERDRATDVFDYDVAAGEAGTLRVGASEMRCWVTASSKDLWWFDGRYMVAELTVRADEPVWTRETVLQFRKEAGDASSADLEFPYDFPHDWKNDDVSSTLMSPYSKDCAPRITVYGPAVNPYVIIGDNRYQVDATVPDSGLLVVDAREHTIVIKDAYGRAENAFSAGVRSDGANVFAKVPTGNSAVSWSGSFGFDVALVEERSEPAWS